MQLWRSNDWIRPTDRSPQVVGNLLDLARRQINDASLEGISPDGRFDHAYAAIRSLCEAALHAAGYSVPKGGRAHERVIGSLRFTVAGDWGEDVDFLDQCRRLRHQSIYERTGVAQRKDADDLLDTARRLLAGVEEWLAREHEDLVPQ